MVLVTISGNVTIPGNYFLPASYQVSNAIKFASQINPSSQLSTNHISAILRILENQREMEELIGEASYGYPFHRNKFSDSYSSRNIKIFHTDGNTDVADLYKARVNNNPLYDPYLREGDVIFVPFEPMSYPKISISGAVLAPYTIAYKEGDSASFLLKVGCGVKDNADIENVILKFSDNQSEIAMKVDKDLNLLSKDYELKPGSTIIVGEKSVRNDASPAVVTVKGEVKKPGAYIISSGNSRLFDVIDLAGGITSEAYLPLAYITRFQNLELSTIDPRRDILQYFQYSDLTLEDTTRYIIDMMLKKPIVSCDFDEAYKNRKSEQNVLLQNGDIIVIPAKPNSVYVFGQVNNPGYVEYSDGKTLKWYVMKAGGFANYAESERARIIRGKNNIWVDGDDDVIVFAGDMIYVPRPPDIPKSVELQNYSILVSILLGAVSVISIAISVYNSLKRN
jgi:protein involved in polysaccharide export with SLBB domain